ncbi:MAG TPA: type II toxin-antitoxin system VapC family toxin [Stellaceae bacterium]|nr:type II toxin-antitoxin system VapC family toxin [Stellaceae bacterium]
MPVKVVDASAVAALLFVEAEADLVVGLFGDDDLVAPSLLGFELANICLKKIRAHPADRDRLVNAFTTLDDLAIRTTEIAQHRVLDLAQRTGLSAYDASYLSLALDLDAALITLDKRLAAAARKLAVPLR